MLVHYRLGMFWNRDWQAKPMGQILPAACFLHGLQSKGNLQIFKWLGKKSKEYFMMCKLWESQLQHSQNFTGAQQGPFI